jgi:hypothetical protein
MIHFNVNCLILVYDTYMEKGGELENKRLQFRRQLVGH